MFLETGLKETKFWGKKLKKVMELVLVKQLCPWLQAYMFPLREPSPRQYNTITILFYKVYRIWTIHNTYPHSKSLSNFVLTRRSKLKIGHTVSSLKNAIHVMHKIILLHLTEIQIMFSIIVFLHLNSFLWPMFFLNSTETHFLEWTSSINETIEMKRNRCDLNNDSDSKKLFSFTDIAVYRLVLSTAYTMEA